MMFKCPVIKRAQEILKEVEDICSRHGYASIESFADAMKKVPTHTFVTTYAEDGATLSYEQEELIRLFECWGADAQNDVRCGKYAIRKIFMHREKRRVEAFISWDKYDVRPGSGFEIVFKKPWNLKNFGDTFLFPDVDWRVFTQTHEQMRINTYKLK